MDSNFENVDEKACTLIDNNCGAKDFKLRIRTIGYSLQFENEAIRIILNKFILRAALHFRQAVGGAKFSHVGDDVTVVLHRAQSSSVLLFNKYIFCTKSQYVIYVI